ncbi:hypothetical protein LUZ61_020076 [Rhynchospora tenuis]|uniref:Uncharacterized protein n=1 Tax=Rhynchospora tenuis TaxID=198213 RepID=A0AAD5ZCI8_9POAL|nr:hypothetical protein LUZ61_020076 [Rhynchospora tenuis]
MTGSKSMREALEKAGAEEMIQSQKEKEKVVKEKEKVVKEKEAPTPTPPATTNYKKDKDIDTPDTREIQVVPNRPDTYSYPYLYASVVPEDPPSPLELAGWYIYGFCSYFVMTVLLPVLFPLLITQVAFPPSDLTSATMISLRGHSCSQREMALYTRLVRHSIHIAGSHLSPLNWASISWAVGLILTAPLLLHTASHLDRGQHQSLILIAATSAGSFACLLTGFFKTFWLFPLYIVIIVGGFIIADAAHTRSLGLLVRGLAAHATGRQLILRRRAAAARLSLHAAAAGGVGSALISAFVYHMLRRSDQLTGLWVVSIFSGLIWFIGICHGLFSNRPGAASSPRMGATTSDSSTSRLGYALLIFNYPHAIGSLGAGFLGSFSTMCIFTSAVLYVTGGICMKPVLVLALWMLYFLFPTLILPMMYPVQLFIRADAVKMQLLGFMVSAFVAGAGFYYKDRRWGAVQVVFVSLIQSAASGLLQAFGRVLLLDCAPAGKEGAFASWLAWTRAAGALLGFAVGSASPGHVGGAFGGAFLGSFLGIVALVFGNVSNVGGLVAAGHVKGIEEEKRQSVHGSDKGEGSIEDREAYGRPRV